MTPPPHPPPTGVSGGEEEAGPNSSNGKEETGGDGDDAPSMPPRMGFSLSLAAASKKPAATAALKPAALGGGADEASRDAPRRELITGVAGGKIASADPPASSRGKKPLIIPALENTFKFGGGGGGEKKAATEEEAGPAQRRYLPESINAGDSKTNEERFVSAGPEEAQRKGVSYGLQTMRGRGKQGGAGGGGGGGGADAGDGKNADEAETRSRDDPLAGLSVTSREWEAARYKQDLSRLPEEGREEDYERMPVESFARALLRGMGWKDEGEGDEKKDGTATAVTRDGRKIDVGVVEFLPRPAGLGLGASLGPSASAASAAAAAPKKKDRRWETATPGGESGSAAAAAAGASLPPRGTTMVDASGRVRHSRRLGEELRPASEFGAAASLLRPGTRVVVSGGAHSGVSASVVGPAGTAPGGGASSSSSSSSTLVRIRLFPSDEEVVVRREHLEEASRGAGSGGGGGGGSDRGREDRDRSGGDRGERDRRRSPPPPPSSASKRQRRRSRSRSRSPPPPPSAKWLLPGIVVKVIDKGLEGGRFYLKRARVVDVPAPGIATLAIISSSSSSFASASLSGVRASSLETAVPRSPGAAVVVVEGLHRGRRGKLITRMEASSSKLKEPTGVVQLRGDLEVVQLPFDWFAEAASAEEERGGGVGGDDDDDE